MLNFKIGFNKIQAQFDESRDVQAAERAEFLRALRSGEYTGSKTIEQFDLDQLFATQALTRTLMEWEARAKEYGIELGDEAERMSNFADHASDGFTPSHEETMIQSCPREQGLEWRARIAEERERDPETVAGTGLAPLERSEPVPSPEQGEPAPLPEWEFRDIEVGVACRVENGEKIWRWEAQMDEERVACRWRRVGYRMKKLFEPVRWMY